MDQQEDHRSHRWRERREHGETVGPQDDRWLENSQEHRDHDHGDSHASEDPAKAGQ